MALRLKKGVSLRGVKPEIAIGLQMIEGFFVKNLIREVWVTSCVDGKHKRGSLHYVGYAVDLRVWAIKEKDRESFTERLSDYLGDEFDCLFELDHIHVEFQPKEKLND